MHAQKKYSPVGVEPSTSKNLEPSSHRPTPGVNTLAVKLKEHTVYEKLEESQDVERVGWEGFSKAWRSTGSHAGATQTVRVAIDVEWR